MHEFDVENEYNHLSKEENKSKMSRMSLPDPFQEYYRKENQMFRLAKYPSFEEQHRKEISRLSCWLTNAMASSRSNTNQRLLPCKHPLSANSWLFVKCCTRAMKRNEMNENKKKKTRGINDAVGLTSHAHWTCTGMRTIWKGLHIRLRHSLSLTASTSASSAVLFRCAILMMIGRHGCIRRSSWGLDMSYRALHLPCCCL